MSITLSSRERTQLKARAHHLKPIVQMGHAGLTDAFIVEVDRALAHHELIKVRIGGADREARDAAAGEVCARTGAAPVQRLGNIVVLWRPKPEET
jgi:RNA-binding protein